MVGVSVKECKNCDHTFTAKSALAPTATAQEESENIRDYFPFEPEKHDDGSYKIQAILGRRLRTDAARKYLRSNVLGNLSATEAKFDHEYLVKYKDISYHHCVWLSALDIDSGIVSGKQLLSRYLTKLDKGDPQAIEDGEIDPTFLEIERILDVREEECMDILSGDALKKADEENGEDVKVVEVEADEAKERDNDEPATLTSRASFADSMASKATDESAKAQEDDDARSVGSDHSSLVLSKMQIFNHVERCRKVLERVWDDPLAAGFVEPVDTELYDDYLDTVQEPMCLSDVRTRLEEGWYRKSGKYMNFLQDMRLIWKACKSYNLYKSQIWYSAHVLGMMTERLFQGWVLSYKEGTVGTDEAIGCPWEETCRLCCKAENDDQLILCDHCDAAYHLFCLDPPLESVPEGTWVCNRCTSWLDESTSRKLLTATQEDEARETMANATEQVIVKVRKKKYLVKWRGLSYRDCTWELPEDIGDDSIIASYHQLNDTPPDEPPLTQEELDMELRKDRARPLPHAMHRDIFFNSVFDVDAEIYAQIRCYHFLKWNRLPPAALLRESGPLANAYTNGFRTSMLLQKGVVDTLQAAESGQTVRKVDSSSNAKSKDASASHLWWTPAPVATAKENAEAVTGEEDGKDAKGKPKKDTKKALKEKEKREAEEEEERVRQRQLFGIAKPTVPPTDLVRGEVAVLLGDLLVAVVRNEIGQGELIAALPPNRPKVPPTTRAPGEVETVMKKNSEGKLNMRVANYFGRIVLVGFLREEKPSDPYPKRHAETRCKQGDILLGVNGVDITHLPFLEAMKVLLSCKTNYVYLRWLRTWERAGEAGKASRKAAYHNRLAQAALMRVREDEGSASSAAEIKAEAEKEAAAFEDDPETDVVQRYFNKYGGPPLTTRPPVYRSLYKGVFPTFSATTNNPYSPKSWTACYWVYKKKPDNEIKQRRVAFIHDLYNRARNNEANLSKSLYKDVSEQVGYCVTLPPCKTELAAALARDKAMLKVAVDKTNSSLVPGEVVEAYIDSESLNFHDVSLNMKSVGDIKNIRDSSLPLVRAVQRERVLIEKILAYTRNLGEKAHIRKSKAMAPSPSASKKALEPSSSKFSRSPGTTAAAASSAHSKNISPSSRVTEEASNEGAGARKRASKPSIKAVNAIVDAMDEEDEFDEEDDDDDDDEMDEEDLYHQPAQAAQAGIDAGGKDIDNEVESLTLSIDSCDTDSDAVEILPQMDESSEEDSDKSSDGSWEEDENGEWKPSKKILELKRPDGPTVRLLRATNEASMPPLEKDWDRYLLEKAFYRPGQAGADPTKALSADQREAEKGPGVAVEQVDLHTNKVIRTWSSNLVAGRNTNTSPKDIEDAAKGKRESAGGFKWKLAKDANAVELAEAMELLDEGVEQSANADKDVSGHAAWRKKLYKTTKTYKGGMQLRDYQLEGLNWLVRCWYQKRSTILADEMGLGKTVQVVTCLEHMFEVENIRGPFLVCVPLSTISHWQREFEGWSNMEVCVYHDTGGGRDMRDVIREFQWYYKGRSRRLLKFQTLITTYDDLIRDYEELAEIPWRICVVDEAHRLRNVNSKLLECMRQVLMRGLNAYGYQHRILLTGTPLQNNTAELWSLLNFIEPAKFPDADKFSSRFGSIRSSEQVEALQKRIAPHLLRRVKEDVAKDIPPKEETIIDVELTTMQKQYYRAIYEHNHGFLMQNLKGSLPKLMNIQMELRKCCNHPFLVQGVEDTEMDAVDERMEKTQREDGARTGSAFDQQKARDKEYQRERMDKSFIPSSGKMVLLDKLLPKLRKEGHKVLIFSQMVRMIDYIEEYCNYREYPVERLDGRVSGNDRQKSIDRFNTQSNSFIFLLSTRAGGVGINLTAADTCIIFDSDWNPQNDVQAMARCHRIGQKKQVTIYRLITRKSFEAEMFDRASRKLGLEQAVLGTRQFDAIEMGEAQDENKVDAKEMEQLLREGAYAVLMGEDDNDAQDFMSNDIDEILQKRSHTTVSEAGPTTESWLNKKRKSGGRTKKSIFTGAAMGDAAEVDVNDPEFWKKVLPDLVTPDSMVDIFQSDFENAEEPPKTAITRKYFKDLQQMMNGLLDLNSRGQLPDKEKDVCMDLLLRISLKEDVFSDKDRNQAVTWLSAIEGSRSRKQRMDLSSKSSPEGPGKKGTSGIKSRRREYSENITYIDDDEYEKAEELDMYGLPVPKKRHRKTKAEMAALRAEAAARAAMDNDGDWAIEDEQARALDDIGFDDDEEEEPMADDDEAWGFTNRGPPKSKGKKKGTKAKKERDPNKPKRAYKKREKKAKDEGKTDKGDELGDEAQAKSEISAAQNGDDIDLDEPPARLPKRKAAENAMKVAELDDTDDEDDLFAREAPPPKKKKAYTVVSSTQASAAQKQATKPKPPPELVDSDDDGDPYAI